MESRAQLLARTTAKNPRRVGAAASADSNTNDTFDYETLPGGGGVGGVGGAGGGDAESKLRSLDAVIRTLEEKTDSLTNLCCLYVRT